MIDSKAEFVDKLLHGLKMQKYAKNIAIQDAKYAASAGFDDVSRRRTKRYKQGRGLRY